MNIVYLVFGKKITYHYEAYFSIASFIAQGFDISNIFIYTDAPEFYKHFEGRVTIKAITPEQLKEWKGKHDFFGRAKIKAIQDVIQQDSTKPVVFIDTDTFVYKYNSDFEKQLNEGKAFLHLREGLLCEFTTKTGRNIWNGLKGKTFSGVTITEKHAMWNSGVVAIPVNRQLDAITLALNLCEEMCETGVRIHFLEQFAISVAMVETYEVLPSAHFIAHYWGNKDGWHQEIQNYFMAAHFSGLTIDEEIRGVQEFDFRKIPIKINPKLGRLRLAQKLEKWLPDKAPVYLQ